MKKRKKKRIIESRFRRVTSRESSIIKEAEEPIKVRHQILTDLDELDL